MRMTYVITVGVQGIYLTDAFQATIGCQRPPPRPLNGLGTFARRLGCPCLSLDKLRGPDAAFIRQNSASDDRPERPGPLGLLDGACMAA